MESNLKIFKSRNKFKLIQMKKLKRISLLALTLIATGAISTAFIDDSKENNSTNTNLLKDDYN